MPPRPPRTKLPGSPASKDSRGSKFGADLVTREPSRWVVGIIVGYSPATQSYRVSTPHGMQEETPRLVRDPGEITVLPVNTQVVLHNELGYFVIDSVLKQAPAHAPALNPARVSEVRGVGGEDPAYTPSPTDASFRNPNDPQDLLQGDWVKTSPDGNLMGVLAGGTNVMKSSPMAQVRTHAVGDMVEVIANVYRQVTAMGNLNITNDGGKTSLIWRAGSDQATENGPNAENWTIRLDVGASGDLFNFEVTRPEGQTLAKIHMSADGRLELVGVGGIDTTSGAGGVQREDVVSDKDVLIRGKLRTVVRGLVDEMFQAEHKTQVSKNRSLLVGNDLLETINNNHNMSVSGKQKIKVGGGPATPAPASGSVALAYEVINGGVQVELGNPASGATSSPAQSFNVVNYAGSFNFAIMPASSSGQFNVLGSTDGCVNLGANGTATPNTSTGGYDFVVTAPLSVMMYEPFKTLIDKIIDYIEQHDHLTSMGPSSPAMAGTKGPLQVDTTPLIPKCKSARVKVGA